MKNETLKQIIAQIKKYNLTEEFKTPEEFTYWVSKLNNIQINNFISLNIDLDEIKNIKSILINDNLLSCHDYIEKINAIKTLKNGDGCWHLYNRLCKPNFLKSKKFYKDIEILSKADTARYGLLILGEDSFINSPYHEEDLKLLVETHDTKTEDPLDWLVSEVLATVAKNINSIKSPYHQADMKLIATAGSKYLQSNHSYPEHSLNNLATNKISLEDKYHLENMQLLVKYPNLSEFLYPIMTTESIIKGKYYREEIQAILNAKSNFTARALYYYIVNPKRKFTDDSSFDSRRFAYYLDKPSIAHYDLIGGKNDPDYINNLIKINKTDDCFIMHYVAILMNPNFRNSPHKNFDLNLLETIKDKDIFMDLYRLMTDIDSQNSKHHIKDAKLISKTQDAQNRNLLLNTATDERSLESANHEYDMNYIYNLDFSSINDEIYQEICYYLHRNGITDPQHKEKLESLLKGIIPERKSDISTYLDYLESQISDNTSPIIEQINKNNSNIKNKTLKLFKKH